jgi:hypothetical protein
VWAPSSQPCIGWLVDEAHKSQLYRSSASSALNSSYCKLVSSIQCTHDPLLASYPPPALRRLQKGVKSGGRGRELAGTWNWTGRATGRKRGSKLSLQVLLRSHGFEHGSDIHALLQGHSMPLLLPIISRCGPLPFLSFLSVSSAFLPHLSNEELALLGG